MSESEFFYCKVLTSSASHGDTKTFFNLPMPDAQKKSRGLDLPHRERMDHETYETMETSGRTQP